MTEKSGNEVLLILSFVIIGCSLRAPITGVGSLMSIIKSALTVSSSIAGLLTTIPLLTFAIVSLFVGGLGEKYGAGKLMLIGLITISIGIVIRSFTVTAGLFIGTVIIGIGIAIGNVLIPGFIKSNFPNKVGSVTGIYTSTMSMFAGLSGAISVPIAKATDWKTALAVWFIMAIAGILIWLPNRNLSLVKKNSTESSTDIKKYSLTWFISLYMGVQSLLFYCMVTWFPTMMQSQGFDSTAAGYLGSLYILLGIPANFIVPNIAGKLKNQSILGIAIGLLNTIGLLLLLIGGSNAVLFAALICCGLCQGSTISFIMAMFGMHTKTAVDAAKLSGLAQSIGYLLAAIGPTLMGKLFDITGNWNLPIIILMCFAMSLIILGYIVGKNKKIGD